MKTIVTFGEVMLRLQSPDYKRIQQAGSFDVYYGGCEANVAVALSQMGEKAAFVTKLPENPLGDACRNEIRKWGVDTSMIVRGAGRMGIYFTEKGASQRPPSILYDRSFSAFSLASPENFDFDRIFNDAEWFHFSGITPALSESAREITLTAIRKAQEKGLKVSCDFNFRSLLWSKQQARKTMSELIREIDLLIINENQAAEVLGIREEDYEKTSKKIADSFGIKKVALTKRRTDSGEVNRFSAMLRCGPEAVWSKEYSIFMIDKVGGGDAFSAGLIYALCHGENSKNAVEFAAASACLKHTIEGDFTVSGVEEIRQLMRNGSARFVR